MKRLIFSDYAEFSNYIYSIVKKDKQIVTTVLSYDNTVELLKWLLLYDDVNVDNINTPFDDYNGHVKDYFITIDTNLIINIVSDCDYDKNEALVEYKLITPDIIFYGKEVNLECISNNYNSENYELIIENKLDICRSCYEDCSNCKHKGTSEMIEDTLELVDYILNHLND